jgi:peptidoglycan hydrolase-like protein with peptidoglycan-binding domain
MTRTNPFSGRMRWVAGAGVALVASVAVVVVGFGLLSTPNAAADDSLAPTSTASVERRTLVAQEEFDGTLGYGGELRVVNELQTSGQSDVSALSQAVLNAQAAYDNAVRTVEAIKNPTAQNIATARAQVRSAEASVLSAQAAAKGPGASQLESAAAQVAQAQAALAAAQSSADGPTPSQVASAQAQLAQANANLVSAQNAANGPSAAQRTQAEAAVANAQIALTADQQALANAQQALAVCQAGATSQPTPTPDPEATPAPTPVPTPVPDCTSQSQAVLQAEARVASDQQNLLVAQAQLADLNSPADQAAAQAGLASAQAQVAVAQAALDALTGPDAAASAQAQLAAAEAAARSAQAALEELTSPDATAQAKAQVSAAKAQLQSAQASLAAILNPTPAALAEAQSNVTVTKASLDAAREKLDQLRGTVTALPDEGSVIERGEALYELDGQSSGLLMYGDRPAWRELTSGLEGEDVRQLQENLIELGFGGDELTASGTFDDATLAAVRAWQAGHGVPETGVIELGEIVFLPGAVRIAGHSVSVGDTVTAGLVVLTATSTDRVVSVDLSADEQGLVTPGDSVEIDLPDGTRVTGSVVTVGTVATAAGEGQGNPTVEVTIVLDDPAASGTIDQAPVDVLITTLSRENVLAVPVIALLALLEGGYAVEVVSADGTTSLVGVETGLFQDGWVEIEVTSGALSEGDQVVVPA